MPPPLLNPDLQQGLLDTAADTTSAAVVAPLTFNTYFSLSSDANIAHDDDDTHQARHQNINSYFSDEEDDQSSPSGGEEVDDNIKDDEELGSDEDDLPLDTFFLPPFSYSRFFLRHLKDNATCPHGRFHKEEHAPIVGVTKRSVTPPRFTSVSLLHDGTPTSSHCQSARH